MPLYLTRSINKFNLARTKSYVDNILRLNMLPVQRACQVNFGS